jgi:hypothetical protein
MKHAGTATKKRKKQPGWKGRLKEYREAFGPSPKPSCSKKTLSALKKQFPKDDKDSLGWVAQTIDDLAGCAVNKLLEPRAKTQFPDTDKLTFLASAEFKEALAESLVEYIKDNVECFVPQITEDDVETYEQFNERLAATKPASK